MYILKSSALDPKRITIEFGRVNHLMKQYQWTGGGGESAKVRLGGPLLEWTLSDFADATWLSSAYEIMKRFLAVARREYELLALGQCSQLYAQSSNATLAGSYGFKQDGFDTHNGHGNAIPFAAVGW